MRIVPLGTLVAADPSLISGVNLEVGTGLWRDETSEWHPWVKLERVKRARTAPRRNSCIPNRSPVILHRVHSIH